MIPTKTGYAYLPVTSMNETWHRLNELDEFEDIEACADGAAAAVCLWL